VPEYGLIIGLSVMAIAVAAVAMISLTTAQPTHADSDFKSDWAVEGGFDIISDADVFRFPTAIAFIPNPGNRPKYAPLFAYALWRQHVAGGARSS
jgi:hypothetical protein